MQLQASHTEATTLPPLLTIEEAARLMRIGRSKSYALAHDYLNSGGTSGLPVIVFGPGCFRVPRWALTELIITVGLSVCAMRRSRPRTHRLPADVLARSIVVDIAAHELRRSLGRMPWLVLEEFPHETSLSITHRRALCMTQRRIAVLMERPVDSHVAYRRSV